MFIFVLLKTLILQLHDLPVLNDNLGTPRYTDEAVNEYILYPSFFPTTPILVSMSFLHGCVTFTFSFFTLIPTVVLDIVLKLNVSVQPQSFCSSIAFVSWLTEIHLPIVSSRRVIGTIFCELVYIQSCWSVNFMLEGQFC